jgi:hypothetical protein
MSQQLLKRTSLSSTPVPSLRSRSFSVCVRTCESMGIGARMPLASCWTTKTKPVIPTVVVAGFAFRPDLVGTATTKWRNPSAGFRLPGTRRDTTGVDFFRGRNFSVCVRTWLSSGAAPFVF